MQKNNFDDEIKDESEEIERKNEESKHEENSKTSVEFLLKEKENLDIMINKADRLYYEGDFKSAYEICKKYLLFILIRD